MTFTFLSLTTNDRERGYLSINTESNSININAYIPKQAGSTHKPLSLKEKEKKKKRPEKERFRVKELNWNPHLVLASLPAVLKKKREENPKSVCIKVPFPMAEGLIKIFRCFSAAWKAFFFYEIHILLEVAPTILEVKSFVNDISGSGAHRPLQDLCPGFLASSLAVGRADCSRRQ